MAEIDKPLPLAQQTAPERIYLDIGEEAAMHEVFSDREVTWSEDNATDHGIEYVRADLAQAVPAGWLLERHDNRYIRSIRLVSPTGEAWRYTESHDSGTDSAFIFSFLDALLSAAQQAPSGGEG